jgi:glycerol-3-phosphate dehydrogenase
LLPTRPAITSRLALACANASSVREKEREPDEASVRAAVRTQGALTVEDVLTRRHRQLFLDARRAIDLAPWVAGIVAEERGRDGSWAAGQAEAFVAEAGKFLPGG